MRLFLALMCVLLVAADSEGAPKDDSLLNEAHHNAWRWSTSVCHVESFGQSSKGQGTGFMSWAYGSIPATIFFTAKHIVENQDSLRVTVLTYNAGKIEPRVFTKVLRNAGKRMYFVPDTSKDVVGLLVTAREFDPGSVTDGYKHFVLPRSAYAPLVSLFEGLPIVICGYPLGLHSREMKPLIRRGSIALVDSTSNTIVLDAQVSPGSSGSAVFIDESDPIGRAFSIATGKSFVGLVHAYLPMRKKYVNPTDSLDQMLVSENAGLGLVVSSDVLIKFVDAVREAAEKLLPSGEK